MLKTSIVMAYHNRERQLLNTLESFKYHEYDNIEVIIVDDCSDKPLRIDDSKYDFTIKVFRIGHEQKKFINPAYAYNLGISKSSGEIVIIQNPECFHFDDIVGLARGSDLSNTVYSVSCFSVDDSINTPDDLLKFSNFGIEIARYDFDNGWYNHSIYRPVGYHFCSIFSAEILNKIGGFDVSYYDGIGYDDDDLVFRIRKNFKLEIVDAAIVIHQHHDSYNGKPNLNLIRRNKFLYEFSTKRAVPKFFVLNVLHPMYEFYKNVIK